MIGPVTGHLGTRVSALLDGRLDDAETERAWHHVHACHACRDLVEREGWVKNRLARLGAGHPGAPDRLKGTLLGHPAGAREDVRALAARRPLAEAAERPARPRRSLGLVSMGGGAVGCAVVGVLALGAATPASAPTPERRLPVAQPSPGSTPGVTGFTPASVRTRVGR